MLDAGAHSLNLRTTPAGQRPEAATLPVEALANGFCSVARTILRSLRSAALLIGTIGVSLLLTLIAFVASLFETWLHSPWHAADWIDTLAGSIAPELLPLASSP